MQQHILHHYKRYTLSSSFRMDFQFSEKEKPRFVRVGFRVPKNGRPKIRNGTKFGELPTNGNQDSFGGLLTNGEPRFVQCLRRMEKPKDSLVLDLVVFRRTENNKLRGSGGFPKIRKRRTKVRFGWASNLRIKWNQDSSRNGLVVLLGQVSKNN
ncbi:hypothetical protein RIR_jg10454.t1 [Rhizophagus irregularis DAOM 181602=DAOM 197198]|nr:hypothetical protein RIR_jg10454.t1 [Rhizophagus irregularis DAOM 181602=DAOM 197198]